MSRSQSWPIRFVSAALIALALALTLAGILVGWVFPHLVFPLPLLAAVQQPIARTGIDASVFLGADITTLGVIIAVLIGYNVAGLQTAGQTFSLALSRAMLVALGPFLLCWLGTTGVALVYLLALPVYVGQLWQSLLWFGAVVLFMISYLWSLPWRLSGEYAARWAVGDLRGKPIDRWESLDGYAVLQTGMASATTRGDLGTIRAMALVLGGFLVGMHDRAAEMANEYDRGRYRALKNLLSGCAQHSGDAPTAAYNLGFITAAILLQAIAIGQPMTRDMNNLYSGLLREFDSAPERIGSLWTGVRHAACRRGPQGAPYLITYWREHRTWERQEPRLTQRVADGLLRLHSECWRQLLASWDVEIAQAEAAEMLTDLYRYVGRHLCDEIQRERSEATRNHFFELAADLLDRLHAQAIESKLWDDATRDLLTQAYEKWNKRIAAQLARHS